jgi:lysophospholipase L1-like esterase
MSKKYPDLYIVNDVSQLSSLGRKDTNYVITVNGGIYQYSYNTGSSEYTASVDGGYWSNVLSAGGGSLSETLDTPTSFTSTAQTTSSIALDWDNVTNATSYQLYKSLTSTGSWSIIYNGSNSYYIDNGLNFATTFYYKIRAIANGYNNSAYAYGNFTTFSTSSILTNGAILDWRFTELTGQRVFNSVGTNTSDDNLIGFSEQYFNNMQYWTGLSYFARSANGYATVTDSYATNRHGVALKASRLQTLSGSFVSSIGEVPGLKKSVTLSAGTYTLSFWVKSNSGSLQNVRLEAPAGTFSSDKNVTDSWSLIESPFTTAGGTVTVAIRNASTSGSLDILIDSMKINSGSSATTYKIPQFDLVLGYEGYSEVTYDPIWSGSSLLFTGSTNFAHAQSQITQSFTNISIHSLIKLSKSSSYQGYIINTPFNDANFALISGPGTTSDSSVTPRFNFGGNSAISFTNYLADNLIHHLVGTYDGTTLKLYIDKVLLGQTTATISPQQINRLLVGDTPLVGGRGFEGQIFYSSLYNVAHTQAEINTQYEALNNILISRGLYLDRAVNFIMWEGDSISTVTSTGLYPRMANKQLNKPVLSENKATVGAQVSTLTARSSIIDAYLSNGFSNNILFVLLGANDMSGAITGTQFYNNLKTYCLARKSAGWRVIACTPLACITSGFAARRAEAVALIRGDNSFYDALCDFAADSTFGPDASCSDTNLFVDGVHPTTNGYTLMAPIAAAAVRTLLI